MSTISSTTSSAASYATQLATASALKRSLNNIGAAIQDGDLNKANSIITAFIKANPQYGAASTSGSSDPISTDFQTLATAVSNNQLGAAQSAWAQVKTDLSKDGVSLSSQTASTAALLAQSKATTDQQILSEFFGGSSSGDSPTASILLGGSSDSGGSVGLSSTILGSWATYENGGNATPSTSSGAAGNVLNTAV